MEMTVRQEERCLEIALIGELDHHAAREIGGRLDRAIEAAVPPGLGGGSAPCGCGWCWIGPG